MFAEELLVTYDGVDYTLPAVLVGNNLAYGEVADGMPVLTNYPLVVLPDYYGDVDGGAWNVTVVTASGSEGNHTLKIRGDFECQPIYNTTLYDGPITLEGSPSPGEGSWETSATNIMWPICHTDFAYAESLSVTFDGTTYVLQKVGGAFAYSDVDGQGNPSFANCPIAISINTNIANPYIAILSETETLGTHTLKIEGNFDCGEPDPDPSDPVE